MTDTFSTKGLKALFSYPFRQPGWEGKLAVLAGLYVAGFIVPVLPWLAAGGYAAELTRRAARGGAEPELPVWQDWGNYLVDGLRLAGAGLLAGLPMLLVFACGFGPYLMSIFGMFVVDSSGGDMSLIAPVYLSSTLLMIISVFCGLFLSIGIGVPLPAAIVHMLAKNSFAALFEAKTWWKIFRANLGGFMIVFFLVWVTSFLLQMITQLLVSTLVLCALAFVAPLVIMPYLSIISAYLFGQAYREGVETLQETDPAVEAETTAPQPMGAASEDEQARAAGDVTDVSPERSAEE